MNTKLYVSGLLLLMSHWAMAQEAIRGKAADANGAGIEGVAVVLQAAADSAYVDAMVTDSLGAFTFQAGQGSYRLMFQHLLYETKLVQVATPDVGTVILKEKDYSLDEVVVRGERPQVKVEGGTLIYDTPQLIKNKPVNNAYEAIRELPGVIENEGNLQLLGAGSLSIVLNGQLTTLSMEQLLSLLKSIPASCVRSTEIMYNAPARYNVKGALINVVIDQQGEAGGKTVQGEVGAEYQQSHYAWGNANANLVYMTPSLNVDLMVKGGKGKVFDGEDMFARHTLDDKVVEIDQINRGTIKPQSGTMRIGADYTFRNKDKLSASYYLAAGKQDGLRTSASVFDYLDENRAEQTFSTTGIDSDNTLHNAQLQYKSHRGLNAGIDFTHYRNPEQQHFTNEGDSASTDMLNNSRQEISKYMAFVNHTLTLKGDWTLNFGGNGSYTKSDTKADYLYRTNGSYEPDTDAQLDDEQTEYGGNAFVEVSHTFGKLSATVSLKGEYFKSDYTSNGVKSVLWDDFALFPNASLSYTVSPQHILQFHLSSDKTYPSYWSIHPQMTYLNSYSVVQGNPSLKPFRSYNGQLLYIFRQKYVFMAFAQYNPDYFEQLPYQSGDELRNVFRYENLDFQLMTGLGAVIPVSLGSRIQSRITLQGIRMQEKSDDFYDLPFDKHKYFAYGGLDNTVNLSDARPNLKLTVSAYYRTPAIQGLYELGSAYDVSAGLKWSFAKDKAILTVKYNNIFESNLPRTIKIDFGNQYSRMEKIDNSYYFGIAFTWKFGGYKETKHEEVDRSRFRK